MPPQTAKSLMKEFRASFRKKKVVVDQTAKTTVAKGAEEEELAKLAEMKDNLGDQAPPFYCDSDLLSFLRARSLNVKEAEKLLKLDENVKRFLRLNEFRPPEDKQEYNFTTILGVDKEGALVRLVEFGAADAKGICNMVSTIDGLRHLIYMVNSDMILLEKENRKSGRNCRQFVYIINLQELSMSQLTYKPAFDMIMQVLKLLQDHFHDVMKKIYFANPPPFFSSAFKLFKPVIQDTLHQKMEVLHNVAELRNKIDADVLPKYLGGDRVDSTGDPKCKEFVKFGSVVPSSLYASNFLDPEDPAVTSLTIPAGATYSLRFPVRQMGCIFKWHLQAKDNDIAVGLFREPFPSGTETPKTRRKKEQEDMSKLEQITPMIRTQCHLCPEEGHTVLWFTGNVVVHFDNSYSWMNSKEVYHKITVQPPTEKERLYLKSAKNSPKGLSQMSLGPFREDEV